MSNRNRNRDNMPLWKLLILQLLLTGLVLCVFAVFHHVIPAVRLRVNGLPAPVAAVERREQQPQPAAETPAPETRPEPEQPEPAPESTPEPPPEPLTWKEKFAEHFSPEPERGELRYSSPNTAVEVTVYAHPEDFPELTYYVADIYITDISQFETGFPEQGTFGWAPAIADYNGAILAINGDTMLTQRDGFLVRNGQIYRQADNMGDICVLYYDGTMATYGPGDYTMEDILASEPSQIWQFGPNLLDSEGQPLEEFNISAVLQNVHPRTAIGYYEPGHYCFVVVDGRQGDYSVGASTATLARLMSSLGCTIAYNLDGGDSSVMVFDGQQINRQSGDRLVNDMLLIRDLPGEEN